MRSLILTFTCGALIACGGRPAASPRTVETSHSSGSVLEAKAVEALFIGDFEGAKHWANESLALGKSSRASAVRAITAYHHVGRYLVHESLIQLTYAFRGGPDMPRLRRTLEAADRLLEAVDEDLALAETDTAFALELCLACWHEDWNGNGGIEPGDIALLQIEYDRNGAELPKDDPRRKPTYRFDAGDITWARAMISFQRAGLNLLLAYDWSGMLALLEDSSADLTFRLLLPERVAQGRALLLAGLEHSDRARQSFLAEHDDDREWLPNPRQRSFAAPLPVDDALYRQWEAIIDDLRRLVRGETALSVQPLVDTLAPELSQKTSSSIDVAQLLSAPSSFTLRPAAIESAVSRKDLDGALREVFGKAYTAEKPASELTNRLARMAHELETGEDVVERKLRYLLWLN